MMRLPWFTYRAPTDLASGARNPADRGPAPSFSTPWHRLRSPEPTEGLLSRSRHCIEDAAIRCWPYGDRMSKAAANMAGVNLAHELRHDRIAVFLLHPGYIRTAMTSGQGTKDAKTAAADLAALLDRLTLAETGTFWHAEGREIPW